MPDFLGLVKHYIEEEEEMVAMQEQQNRKPSQKVILVHISSNIYIYIYIHVSVDIHILSCLWNCQKQWYDLISVIRYSWIPFHNIILLASEIYNALQSLSHSLPKGLLVFHAF